MRRRTSAIIILALGLGLGGIGSFAWYSANSGLSRALKGAYIPKNGKSLTNAAAIKRLEEGSTRRGVIGEDDSSQVQLILPLQVDNELVYRISVFAESNDYTPPIDHQDHRSARDAVEAVKDQGVERLWPYSPPGTE